MKKGLMVLLPVAAGIMWGSSGTFVRYMSSGGLGRIEILSTRFFIAVILMSVFIALADRSLLKIERSMIPYILGLGASVMGLNLFYNEAVAELSLSLAAVLLGMAPVFVVVFAAYLFREKLTAVKIVCIAVAIAGCVLVSGIADRGLGTVSAFGVLMGIAAAFVYSFYSIFTKYLLKKGAGSLTITFYGMLVAATVLLPLTDFGTVGDYLAADTGYHCTILLAHALLVAVLPYVFYAYAMHRVEAGTASTIVAGMEPITATVCGLVFFSEEPTLLMAIGIAVTIAALYRMCREPVRE